MCKAFDITCENLRGFPDGSVLKNPHANAGDMSSIHVSGEGNGPHPSILD